MAPCGSGGRQSDDFRIAGSCLHLHLRHGCGCGCDCGCGCGYDCGCGCDFRILLRILIAAHCWTNRTWFFFCFGFAREHDRRLDGMSRTLEVLKLDLQFWGLYCHSESRLLLVENRKSRESACSACCWLLHSRMVRPFGLRGWWPLEKLSGRYGDPIWCQG